MSTRLSPTSVGYLNADTIADQLDRDPVEVETALEELATSGVLTVEDPKKFQSPDRMYRATRTGLFAAERERHRRKHRQEPLRNQLAYSVADLILALLYHSHSVNSRLTGAVWGMSTAIPKYALTIWLHQWSEDELSSACETLIAEKVISSRQAKWDHHNTELLDLTPRGKKRYQREVAPRLKLKEDEGILDAPPDAIELFFAWQSEFKPARNLLFDIVPKVVAALNARGDMLRPLVLVEASEPGEGALRIDVALEAKIASADYFLGDLTPVYAYKGRLRVNENVLVETGFALASKPAAQIVLVALDNRDVDGDGSANPQPSFDIRHVRRLVFKNKKEAVKKITTELTAMLERDGWLIS